MKRVLIDTNVCIDFILKRMPNFVDAKIVFEEIAKGSAQGLITASMVTDIFYLLQKANGKGKMSFRFPTSVRATLAVAMNDMDRLL
ncbi:MAG: PIN domain-containing protein [Marinilabiliaceae bacterium]|nr:PIN domain-containing protein [Marinilabiliaceae bacterium]